MMKPLYYLILSLTLTGCISEDELKLPYQDFTPVSMSDGWSISSPEAENIDRSALEEAYHLLYSPNDLRQILSLVVIRNGKLISEGYCRTELDRTRPNAIWSCTKSFTSLVTGIAFEEKYLDSLDDPISKYLPSYTDKYPDKKDITMRHLLTMKGGINFSNDGIEGQTDKLLRELPDDCVDFILGLSLIDPPGTVFAYNDGLPIIMSAVIQSRTGITTADYAKEKLFSPLGITNYKWDMYPDGVTHGAFGLWMTPRDMAKVGLMVHDSGRWNGKQVVPYSWLAQSTSTQVITGGNPYGYYWWINPNYDCYFMAGHGGQYVFIVPSKKLVVVITSEPFTQDEFQLDAAETYHLLRVIMEGCH